MSDPLQRAMSGYDEQFERKLVDAITETIADTSMMTIAGGDRVLVLRTGEIANALTTILASTLARSPAATRSRGSIKQVADSVRRKLLARVRQAERDPQFADFKNRCFHAGDRERGGRA
jgi:hypothetical protein